MKPYRAWTPTQSYLFPPSPSDWLPENHVAWFILDVVEQLDIAAIETVIQKKDPRGVRPLNPRMLLAVLFYAYAHGMYSSRKIERACWEDVAFRVLSGNTQPDHSCIADFRRVHIAAFDALFVQVLQLCARAGLCKLGHVSLDGTKILASASKHKAMSYQRMHEEQARLRREVEVLTGKAEAADADEDRRIGKGVSEDDLPKELVRREKRLERIAQLQKSLEEEAAQARADELRDNAEALEKKAQSHDDPTEVKRLYTRAGKSRAQADELAPERKDDDEGMPHHSVPTEPDGKPKPKAQRNFTDSDSRIMTSKGAFVQGYNAQVAVDGQVIVAQGVSNQAPDSEHMVPMVTRIGQNLGRFPEAILADTGYFCGENVDGCIERGVTPYIATGRQRHADGEMSQAMPANAKLRANMNERLSTPAGRALYRRRKTEVEPVFGQIKSARGFRTFSMRGKQKVRGEWALVCLIHNLLKLFGASESPAMA